MIKIESPVGNIIMFDEIAIELIKMMGKNPTLPGALLTKDMGLALRTLQNRYKSILIPGLIYVQKILFVQKMMI